MIYKKIFDYFDTKLDLKNNFDILKKEVIVNKNTYILYYSTSLIDVMQFDYLIESLKERRNILPV